MSPGRALAAGAAVIVTFGLAAVAVIFLATGPEGGARSSASGAAPLIAAPGPASPAGGPVPAASPGEPPPARAAARPQPFQPSVRGLPQAPQSSPWEQVPVAVRLADLGPLAAPVNAGLQEARREMARCFEAERARLAMADAPAPDPEVAGPAVLLLRLQSRERGLDVAGVDVEARGTATAELVACCRAVLDRWSFPAEAAAPGKRYRLKWTLQ